MSSKKPIPQFNGEIDRSIDTVWTKQEKEDIKKTGVKILHEKCDKLLAESKQLPLDSYLVTYEVNGVTLYDIVQCSAKVKIFDAYYDKFGAGALKSMKWTDGTVNPKLYGATKPEQPKKRGR
jgi:hypothetical protein